MSVRVLTREQGTIDYPTGTTISEEHGKLRILNGDGHMVAIFADWVGAYEVGRPDTEVPDVQIEVHQIANIGKWIANIVTAPYCTGRSAFGGSKQEAVDEALALVSSARKAMHRTRETSETLGFRIAELDADDPEDYDDDDVDAGSPEDPGGDIEPA